MNSALDFVKKHRSKIAAIATAAGGAYLLKKALDQHKSLSGGLVFQSTGIFKKEERTLLESRKQFIFESYQESCDKQIKETLDCLVERLNSLFNTDELIERLKTEPNIPLDEKISIWEQLRLKTVAKVMAVAYLHSIVILAFKIQKTILCRETVKNFSNNRAESGGMVDFLTSFFKQPTNNQSFTDPKAQQIFLNCIHYLTTHGVTSLFDRVDKCTAEIVNTVKLSKELDTDDLKTLLEKVKFRIDGSIRNVAELVVPVIKPTRTNDFQYDSAHLDEMLTQFASNLQSQRGSMIISSFVQRYINEVVELVDNQSATVKQPLAKILPLLNNGMPTLSQTSYQSVYQQNISSTDLYQYCHSLFVCGMKQSAAQHSQGPMPKSRFLSEIFCVVKISVMVAERQRLLSLIPSIARCKSEASTYGSCVSSKAEKISHLECNKEFLAFMNCVTKQAALASKINLREQLPKYLGCVVDLHATQCVINELRALGSELSGALRVCESFDVAKCPHHPTLSAAECIAHMARRMSNPKRPKYIIASQDQQLLSKLRDSAGIPLLSIHSKCLHIERPSKASERNVAEKLPSDILAVKQLKESVLSSDLPTTKTKKKVKGPNPLSCKKKKSQVVSSRLPPNSAGVQKKKARRRKKTKDPHNPTA